MLLETLGYESIWVYTISVIVMVSMVTALLSCLCCRRKQEIKNDLLGLEGMVKLTNPEDTLVPSVNGSAANNVSGNGVPSTPTGTSTELASATGFGSEVEQNSTSKRTSNAPHRSLPDIPIAEPVGDNNSELYATVGDKVQDLPQGRSPNTSLKKQTSVSQHSSISQADDISSPYARVRSPPHAYDKLRRMEHPYAQVIQPGTSGGTAGGSGIGGAGGGSTSGTGNNQLGSKGNRSKPRDGVDDDDEEEEEDDDDEELMSPISRRESAQNLDDREVSTADIPAASAIAGRVSASQDLPYMTPPIVQPPTQHFSGDSQDSSKGYTSISVREPLANLLPQNHSASQQGGGAAKRRQILGDSHYATVSDDSDEMYAAIDDPSTPGGGDLYTSGSETYAQIQPPPNAVTVAVEINMGASSRPLPPPVSITPNDGLDAGAAVISNHRLSNHSTMTVGSGGDEHMPLPVPPPPPPLSATIHGESTGGLRASQPHVIQHSRQASSSSCTSSVGNLGSPKPEKRQANSPLPPTPKTLKHQSNSSFFSNSNQSVAVGGGGGTGEPDSSSPIANGSIISSSAASKPKKSPSKDLEGMYAKVMKKNKLSKVPSQNASPVPLRKDGTIDEQQHQQQLQQFLADSATDALSNGGVRKQPIFAKMATVLHHHRHNDQTNDPGYDTIATGGKPTQQQPPIPADYAKIQKLNRNVPSSNVSQGDTEPGYESLPDGRGSIRPDPGYETLNRSPRTESDSDPNYEVLRPATGTSSNMLAKVATVKTTSDPNRDSDGYSSIREPGAGNRSANGGTARNRLDFGAGGHGDDDTDGSSVGGGTAGPGYSSIRETRRDEYDPGYSVISERKKPPPGHDYASITEEAKRRKPNINNNLEPVDDDSDIYSSIPHTLSSGTLTLPSPGLTSASASMVVSPVGVSVGASGTGGDSGSGTNYCTIPERPGSGGVPVTTTNLSSSPGYSSISETRTTPSSTDGDGSTSSPDQPIGYGKHNNSNNTNTTTASITTNNSLSRLSSNYESLTGSESDPNYESVKYLNVKENPYERLHNEAGAAGIVVVDPLRKSVTIDSLTTDSDTATPTPSTVGDPAAAGAVTGTTSTPPVSDYFQV
uniref:Uncharacterized protein n=1 Tax=Anopheles darlingi TaxID=43151 RepID=A0A2M4CI38_ANODA